MSLYYAWNNTGLMMLCMIFLICTISILVTVYDKHIRIEQPAKSLDVYKSLCILDYVLTAVMIPIYALNLME